MSEPRTKRIHFKMLIVNDELGQSVTDVMRLHVSMEIESQSIFT